MTLEQASQKIGSVSKVYSVTRVGNFWEFVVDKFGDVLTFRVYDDGTVTER